MMLVAALFVAFLLNTSDALAAEPSLMRVMVVPSAGQMSLVVEMSDQARSVTMQQASATEVVIEAGPIAAPVPRQILEAPSGLPLVKRVALDERTTDGHELLLKLNVTMKQSAPGSVRVVGRRIYLDFATSDPATPVVPTRSLIATSANEQPKNQPQKQTNVGLTDDSTYRDAVSGAASRFEQIQPFLVSATTAAAPNPAVLNAVSDAISGLQQSMRGLQSSPGSGGSMQLLVSAVSMAAQAVSPDFHGDRASKAKESLAVFAAAKAQLQ